MTNQMDTNVTMTTIELLEFDNVKGYIDPHGRAMLLADDIARELGFDRIKEHKNRPLSPISGGQQYYISTDIRWDRINQYLAEYGFPPTGRGQYLPEDAVYYLAIKANNEKAKNFHRLLVEDIIPYFREKVSRKQYEFIKHQQERLNQTKPAMDYYQQAVEDDIETVPLSMIADNYGMTPQALNSKLYSLGFHHPIGDGWVINEQYKDQGLVKTRKGRARNQVGIFDFITGYTEKGRLLIHQLLNQSQPMQQVPQTINNYGQYNNYYPAPPVPGPAPGCGHPIVYNTEQYCPNIKPGTICPLIFSDPRLNSQFR